MEQQFTEYYKDVKRLRKFSMKGVLRNTALSVLSAASSESALKKPRVEFLYIHHTFRDEEKQFDSLLQRLSRDHQFISYSEGVKKVLSGEIDKPYITFSSDDGFKNNLAAAEILNKYNASACFFINPGIIGETDYNKIKKHCSESLRFPVVDFLNWDEVGRLQAMGHEIGGHTMMHMNIAEHSADEVNSDLQTTYDILKKHAGHTPHFAFPYGRFFHFSAAGRKAVFDSGFETCATAERGCHVANGTPIKNTDLCIRRDQVVLGWELSHIMYFIINSANKATAADNFFPPALL